MGVKGFSFYHFIMSSCYWSFHTLRWKKMWKKSMSDNPPQWFCRSDSRCMKPIAGKTNALNVPGKKWDHLGSIYPHGKWFPLLKLLNFIRRLGAPELHFPFSLTGLALQHTALSILYMERTGRVRSILFVLFLVWLDLGLSLQRLPPGFELYWNLCSLTLGRKLYGANAELSVAWVTARCESGYTIAQALLCLGGFLCLQGS